MRLHISTLVVVITTAAALGVLLGQPCAGASLSHEVLEYLRNRIETAGVPPRIAVGEEMIYSSVALPRFYERRTYQPAWIDDHGPLPRVSSLIQSIKRAEREGLKPVDYHLNKIEAIFGEVPENQNKKIRLNPRRLVDLDLLLTDAFLIYGSHLLAGRVNPETIDSEWHANRREADIAAVLQGVLESNRIEDALESLLPSHEGYFKLCEALVRYRDLALDISPVMVPEGLKMQKGDHGERVNLLRTRLMGLGDLKPNEGSLGNSDLFDDPLEQAVRRFQKRHGLDVDGVVGPATLAALNVPVVRRVRQIMLNMERWRWLPQDLGQRYILVNIADFKLDVIEGGQPALAMRVIVGKGYRRTPVFSAQMTYLVLSPYWHVPPNIAVQDKLAEIRKDPGYLEKQHMRVFQSWGAEAKELDPKGIDWSKVTARTFLIPTASRSWTVERTGTGQVHVSQQIQRVPTRHAVARALRKNRTGI